MGRTIRYITHPQVLIEPDVKIDKWHLSPFGKSRVNVLASSGALKGSQSIFSSGETKALETAWPLATALGLSVTLREDMHENDRSATGFLPPAEFEATADLFFGNPTLSVRGWETAAHAQQRVVRGFETCLSMAAKGDILFVGHGAVGTLLYCHLAGLPISRMHDQGPGGGGSFFEITCENPRPTCGWRPIEILAT